MERIHFWNGNKSSARQGYERDLLEACLSAGKGRRDWCLSVDSTDYPSAVDEGNVLSNGADVLVTVAGNEKFADRRKILIPQPLAKGLLGYRLLVVREESLPEFQRLTTIGELQALCVGIPETWADADLLRYNQFRVVEKGTFGDLFRLLKEGAFDYATLGANEIEAAFAELAEPLGGLCIEPSILLHYAFPLVFYVHPEKPGLAGWIESGLRKLTLSGELDQFFRAYHGNIVERLRLRERRLFTLENPIIPAEMRDFRSSLLDERDDYS